MAASIDPRTPRDGRFVTMSAAVVVILVGIAAATVRRSCHRLVLVTAVVMVTAAAAGVPRGGSAPRTIEQAAARRAVKPSEHNNVPMSNVDQQLNIGLILPYTNFGVREYIRSIASAVTGLHRSRGPKLSFLKQYHFNLQQVHSVMFALTPSPTGTLCLSKWPKYH